MSVRVLSGSGTGESRCFVFQLKGLLYLAMGMRSLMAVRLELSCHVPVLFRPASVKRAVFAMNDEADHLYFLVLACLHLIWTRFPSVSRAAIAPRRHTLLQGHCRIQPLDTHAHEIENTSRFCWGA